jgi:outer membrane murein-binding lipoprotein Lpp
MKLDKLVVFLTGVALISGCADSRMVQRMDAVESRVRQLEASTQGHDQRIAILEKKTRMFRVEEDLGGEVARPPDGVYDLDRSGPFVRPIE